MTDLTKPFFGNPRETAKADKARKLRAVPYETTWLDEVLRGMFGENEPSGSLAESGALDTDPLRAAGGEQKFSKKRAANSIGQAAGVANDLSGLVNPATVTAGGLAAVMSMSNLPKGLSATNKGRQAGAIRIGGNPDLYAAHAFSASKADDIVQSGYLRPPSIGISHRELMDYGQSKPKFIFRAGALDPEKQMGAMVNRDGYFHNPTGENYLGQWDPQALKNEIAYHLNDVKKRYGAKDLRLSQFFPGDAHGLSIGVSPSFKSFKQYENSPHGAGALTVVPPELREGKWREIGRLIKQNTPPEMLQRYGPDLVAEPYAKDILLRYNTNPKSLTPAEREIVKQSLNSPSAMAEFKLYDKLDLNPNDAVVYLPGTPHSAEELNKRFGSLRDKGFQFTTSSEILGKYANDSRAAGELLPDLVPSDGSFKLPPRLGLPKDSSTYTHGYDDFLEFVNPQAGGSPPLSKAKPADPWKAKQQEPLPDLLGPDFKLSAEKEEFLKTFGIKPEKVKTKTQAESLLTTLGFQPKVGPPTLDLDIPLPLAAKDPEIWKKFPGDYPMGSWMGATNPVTISGPAAQKMHALVNDADEIAAVLEETLAKVPQSSWDQAINETYQKYLNKEFNNFEWHGPLAEHLLAKFGTGAAKPDPIDEILKTLNLKGETAASALPATSPFAPPVLSKPFVEPAASEFEGGFEALKALAAKYGIPLSTAEDAPGIKNFELQTLLNTPTLKEAIQYANKLESQGFIEKDVAAKVLELWKLKQQSQ